MAVLEGVLAIHKPPFISSFDVIRTITPLFRQSPIFQPLIERDRARRSAEKGRKKHISKSKQALAELKIGHGGTLDPLATGVLVVGIGNGTKSLQDFLNGTKEYECTLLFGAATDSYDVLGKVVKTAPWEHVTEQSVEEALERFKGEILQLPPVYSAIRVDGKHLYEYAREGLPLPEIKKRPVTIYELELLEWLPPDKHEFDLPSQEADAEAKIVAERAEWPKSLMNKRKRDEETQASDQNEPPQKFLRSSEDAEAGAANSSNASETTADANQTPSESKKPAIRPSAARIRMKVSSGFYVRSLCHDIGIAVGSVGVMATLVRARQSNFKLGENVIEYEAFEKGDKAWEPQVRKSLEDWQRDHPKAAPQREGSSGKGRFEKSGTKRVHEDSGRKASKSPEAEARRRRNTSSDG